MYCVALLQVGDGTTSVVLLAVEFLKQIKQIVEDGVHPQAVIKSYRKATNMVSFISHYIFEFCFSPLSL